MADTANRLTISELAKIERKKQNQQMLRQPALLALIVVLIVILCIFSFYPILEVLIQTVWDGKTLDFSVLKSTLSTAYFWRSFRNSVFLGLVSATLATLIGFIFAFSVTRVKLPLRKFFHTVAMLPIVSPPFVIALAVILLFGRSGVITKDLLNIKNSNVYGLHSLIFVQTLSLFPLAYLNLKGILEAINTSVEDAAQSLGASRWKVFRSVTLPLCVPSIFSAFLIVFIKSLSDFGNPQILGGNYSTLSSQAYMQINGMHNTRVGSLIALSILAPSMIAYLLQKYWVSKKSFVSVTGKPTRGSGEITERHIAIPLFVCCLILAFIILLLYGTVVWISFVKTWGVDMSLSLDNFKYALTRGGNYIKDSIFLSVVATPITAFGGMLIAFLLIRKKFYGKKIIEFSTMLTFAVPGIVMGIGYILAFNKAPILLTGTPIIIILAMVFRNLSVGIEAGTNSLRQIDGTIEEASSNLGASSITTFRRITLPMMKSAMYVSLVNSFVRSMTSISAVIFVVSVRWNLLTVLIMSEVEASRFGTASAYCVILMGIVLLAFALLQLLVNQLGKPGRRVRNES